MARRRFQLRAGLKDQVFIKFEKLVKTHFSTRGRENRPITASEIWRNEFPTSWLWHFSHKNPSTLQKEMVLSGGISPRAGERLVNCRNSESDKDCLSEKELRRFFPLMHQHIWLGCLFGRERGLCVLCGYSERDTIPVHIYSTVTHKVDRLPILIPRIASITQEA